MTSVAVATTRPWRLGARTRKSVLVVHLVSVGSWIGLDVAMAVVIFTSILTDDDRVRALAYQALELFVVWPLFVSGMVCLLSGILLGLGTKYGLLRYWWVAVKLGLNLLLTALVLLSLRGGIAELAEEGRRLAAGGQVLVGVSDMIYPPIVSPTCLLIAVLLAVFKPWGRIRRQEPGRAR
jgi:hypothetical protein